MTWNGFFLNEASSPFCAVITCLKQIPPKTARSETHRAISLYIYIYIYICLVCCGWMSHQTCERISYYGADGSYHDVCRTATWGWGFSCISCDLVAIVGISNGGCVVIAAVSIFERLLCCSEMYCMMYRASRVRLP